MHICYRVLSYLTALLSKLQVIIISNALSKCSRALSFNMITSKHTITNVKGDYHIKCTLNMLLGIIISNALMRRESFKCSRSSMIFLHSLQMQSQSYECVILYVIPHLYFAEAYLKPLDMSFISVEKCAFKAKSDAHFSRGYRQETADRPRQTPIL